MLLTITHLPSGGKRPYVTLQNQLVVFTTMSHKVFCHLTAVLPLPNFKLFISRSVVVQPNLSFLVVDAHYGDWVWKIRKNLYLWNFSNFFRRSLNFLKISTFENVVFENFNLLRIFLKISTFENVVFENFNLHKSISSFPFQHYSE